MSDENGGLLAIWNDIAGGAENEFRRWHSREHLPERMSVPGFKRGRRLFSSQAQPRWLTLYEVDDASVLSSTAYLDRLNNPTEWTQSVLPSFVATERMGASIAHRHGSGRGGVVGTVRLWGAIGQGAELDALLRKVMDTSGALAGVAAIATETPQQTRERGLRQGDLAPSEAVLLLELGGWPEGDVEGFITGIAAERVVTDLYRLEHDITSAEAGSS